MTGDVYNLGGRSSSLAWWDLEQRVTWVDGRVFIEGPGGGGSWSAFSRSPLALVTAAVIVAVVLWRR